MQSVDELLEKQERNDLSGKFFDDIGDEVYHDVRSPGLSKSALIALTRSEAHYLQNKQAKMGADLKLGSALHLAFLQPDLFYDKFSIDDFSYPEGVAPQSKIGRQMKAEFREKNKFKNMISYDEFETIQCMIEALKSHPFLKVILEDAVKERTFYSQHESGILRKARPDIFVDNKKLGLTALIDLKSTRDARDISFRKDIANYFYDVQAAWYLDVVSDVVRKKIDKFIFIAIEKEPPYGIMLHSLDEGSVEAGRAVYQECINKILENKKNNNRTYPIDIKSIALPHWAFNISDRI